MKLIILVTFFFILLSFCSTKILDPTFDSKVNIFCSGFKLPNTTDEDQPIVEHCLNISRYFSPDRQSTQIRDYFNEVYSKYEDYFNFTRILESRVSRNQSNLINALTQSMDYLEIGQAGQLIIVIEGNENFSIDNSINLDPTISLSTQWTNYKILDNIVNETRSLQDCIKTYDPIVKNEIVWVNQSVKINGSCCLIANVTLEPGKQMITRHLHIKKDNNNMHLDGEFAWGFMINGDHELNFNISNVIIFSRPLKAIVLESPSIDLTNVVHNELIPININGKLSFNQLELENVTLYNEDLNHAYSLLSTVKIRAQETADLCHLEFSKVDLASLKGSKIGGLDLADLLTTNRNQSSSVFEIAFKEMKLDGSSLTKDHQFAVKMLDNLSTFIETDNLLYYDSLTFDNIKVASFNTDTWDSWLVNDSNETYHFDNVTINGSVYFDYVNDLKYDHDLITLDGDEIIDSTLIFEDELIIPDDLANRLLKNEAPMDNWVIKGDLAIDGQLNNIEFGQFITDLVPYSNQTADLTFLERVEASDCNFGIIDWINLSNFINIQNISKLLTFNNLKINNLILDQVNISSCSMANEQLKSDEISPINQLNIIDLETTGTINTLKPFLFLVNCSDQDFTQLNGSLEITANVSFKNLLATNCDTPGMNDVELERLLRADIKLKWPETLTLKSSNITSFTNPWLINSLSNVMLNGSDQTINADVSLQKKVEFIKPVLFNSNESSINFWMDVGNDGDIHWGNLEIYGNLTVTHNLYSLDKMTNVIMNQGAIMRESLSVKNDISSQDIDIYTKSAWKVYKQSTISSCQNLTVDKLTIEKDLLITNQEIKPWLSYDSLEGIEYYHEITLSNLTADFNGNITYIQLNSNSSEMKLEDVANLTSDNQLYLYFDDGITIKENITSDSDVNLNLVNMHV